MATRSKAHISLKWELRDSLKVLVKRHLLFLPVTQLFLNSSKPKLASSDWGQVRREFQNANSIPWGKHNRDKREQKCLAKFNKEGGNKKWLTNTNHLNKLPDINFLSLTLTSISQFDFVLIYLFLPSLFIVLCKLWGFLTMHGMFGAWE